MAPRFLSALHAELYREFGADEARVTLQQIGFLHGYQDAQRALQNGFAHGSEHLPITTPPIAIRFRCVPDAEPPGAIELHGSWPECTEASMNSSRSPAASCGCALTAGYTSGWFSGVLNADLLALETSCRAQGGGACAFVAREAEAWQQMGDENAQALLTALPFGVLRELVDSRADPVERECTEAVSSGHFDAESGAVHIWDSVMVIPYAGLETALEAISLIGRDRGARRVSVVVVDLTGCVIDEGLGAPNLAQIVRAVEDWDAETILAGVGPLSERSVANLPHPPLFVESNIQVAIACAFRVADSQRSTS